MVPIIETMRLRLRALRESDLDVQAEMLGDPEYMRHLGGQPLGREETWRKILCGLGLWIVNGYGYWSIEHRESGDYIGQVGFADFKRAMDPSIEGIPEMGWLIAPAAQRHGYAGEAVRAALDWADSALVGREIVAIIDAGNAPSIRVAESAGFSVRQPASYRDEPILLFRRPANGGAA